MGIKKIIVKKPSVMLITDDFLTYLLVQSI